MPKTPTRGTDAPPSRPAARTSSRSKRQEILTIATEYFGREGYEDTKWADVAAAVGVGSTALYHYFESKLHCLYVIMAEAVETFEQDFATVTNTHEDFDTALVTHLRTGFDLTDHEVLRNRVLVAEQGLVGITRTSPREEEARRIARERTRDLEFAWANFLTRGMQQRRIPESDPRLMARAILGLYNSIWHWYRPRGTLSLTDLAAFFIPRQLALIGLTPAEIAKLMDRRAPRARRAK